MSYKLNLRHAQKVESKVSISNNKSLRKRQKKGDVQSDFRCNTCLKEYLSYPALSTHIKQKHDKNDIKNIQRPASQGTRGRPKREEILQDQSANMQSPPQALQIQIESKQCLDEMLLDLWQLDLKYILLDETDIRDADQIVQSLDQTCNFLQQENKLISFQDENYDQLLVTFKTIMDKSTKDDDIKIVDDLVVLSIDESMCIFWKELSLSLNISFLQHVQFILLIMRNYLNQSQTAVHIPQLNNFNHDQFNPKQLKCFTHLQNPSAIEKEASNDVISKFIPLFTNDIHFVKKFYVHINEKNELFLSKQISDQVIKIIMLYFVNWLFYRRYSAIKLSYTEE